MREKPRWRHFRPSKENRKIVVCFETRGFRLSLGGVVSGLFLRWVGVGADAQALNWLAGGSPGATAVVLLGLADEGALGRGGRAGGLEHALTLRGVVAQAQKQGSS